MLPVMQYPVASTVIVLPDFAGPGDDDVEPVFALCETDSTAAGGGSPGAAVEGVANVVVGWGGAGSVVALGDVEEDAGEVEPACAGGC